MPGFSWGFVFLLTSPQPHPSRVSTLQPRISAARSLQGFQSLMPGTGPRLKRLFSVISQHILLLFQSPNEDPSPWVMNLLFGAWQLQLRAGPSIYMCCPGRPMCIIGAPPPAAPQSTVTWSPAGRGQAQRSGSPGTVMDGLCSAGALVSGSEAQGSWNCKLPAPDPAAAAPAPSLARNEQLCPSVLVPH